MLVFRKMLRTYLVDGPLKKKISIKIVHLPYHTPESFKVLSLNIEGNSKVLENFTFRMSLKVLQSGFTKCVHMNYW